MKKLQISLLFFITIGLFSCEPEKKQEQENNGSDLTTSTNPTNPTNPPQTKEAAIAIPPYERHTQDAEVQSFVLPKHSIVDVQTGDINGDGKMDKILIVEPKESKVDMPPRIMLLLLRQDDGKLKEVKRNNEFIMCKECGGTMPEPYRSCVINGKGFAVRFEGGSSTKWFNYHEFTYDANAQNWYLSKIINGGSDITGKTDSVTITTPELVKNQDFEHCLPGGNVEQWDVIADKTYFFTKPDEGSKKKAYLIKGNQFNGIAGVNYVAGYYENGDKTTYGLILKKDLKKAPAPKE